MTGAAGQSWLVPLADLSMILFVVTGASVAQIAPVAGGGTPPLPPVATHPLSEAGSNGGEAEVSRSGFVQSVPVAVLVDGPGNPPLAQWIAAQATDRTGQLTIEGRYADPSRRASVSARTADLADQARAAGVDPRVIVAPGAQTEVAAVFAYDLDPQLAQGLLQTDQ